MKTTELKPCPNCGGQPKIHKTHKKFYVECDGDCWTQTGKHSYQEDAVKEWNTQIAVAKEGRQMTDHKSTDEEIIKALRELQEMSEFTPPICHYEKDITEPPFCKPFEQFQNDAKVALALINRQKTEIERLKKIGDDKTSEILRHATAIGELHKQLETAKSEAIKEFAERLIDKCTDPHWCVWMNEIEDLVTEMTENKR